MVNSEQKIQLSVRVKKIVRGYTLIEALMFLFIFSVITMAFYETWNAATRHIINTKNRLGAVAVANQQMEIIRSIIFDDIGTTTGIPNGTLTETQVLSVNTAVYTVHTVVQYVDDPTDGTLAALTDMAPNDYKKVTITVSWGNATPNEQVTETSLFSLDGVESVAAGTGILSINVLNAAGLGVSGAVVHITNSTVAPAVDITASTDANGNISFPGAPASVQGYRITVTKGGYYGNATYPPFPTSAFEPVNTHATVVAGSLTAQTLVTDQMSSIAFQTKDPFGSDIPNIDFGISGGLIIGTNPADGSNVTDYTQSTSTDDEGEKDLTSRSMGEYAVTLDAGETGYRFVRLSPEEPTFGTINLSPNTTKTVTMVLADKTVSSALITVTNSVDGQPIAGASVQLSNVGLVYDTTVTTDTYGQAFFPTTNVPLVAGTYDIVVSATGFTTKNTFILVAGNALETSNVALNPS